MINAHCARAKIHRFEKGDAAFRELARLMGNEWLSEMEVAKLQLALANAMEDVGNFSVAFDMVVKANIYFATKRPFKVEPHKEYLVRVAERFQDPGPVVAADPKLPVLIQIVGMSRSGKSLVEDVLCHSDDVHGMDEDKAFITEFNAFLKRQNIAKSFPDCMQNLSDEMCLQFGREHLKNLQLRSPNARYFINTIPASFPFLGLLFRCIPGLVVINCQRDPMDQAIESYFKHYQEGNAYSYDLASTGEFWLHYRSLMRHWQNLYEDRILTVNYEELVSDTEQQVKRIFGHCDLEMPASLKDVNFHADRVGHWKNYQKELAPLLQAFRNVQAVS